MRYNRILLILIPVGILLSGCSQKTATPANPGPAGSTITGQTAGGKRALTTTAQHTQPLPNYLKFNPHGVAQLSHADGAIATKYPNIFARLFTSRTDNEKHIEYITTDRKRQPGDWHSKDRGKNETANSTLFKTTFKDDIDVEPTADGQEVTITGRGTDGMCYEWQSDSKLYSNSDMNDSDVRWIPVQPCD